MLLLESFLSFSVIGFLLVITLLAIRDASHLIQGQLLIALSICVSALLIATLPDRLEVPSLLHLIARGVSVFNIGLLWWFVLSLLQDDFKITFGKVCLFVFFSLGPVVYFLHDLNDSIIENNYLVMALAIIPWMMISHLIYESIKGVSNDLVAARRKARFWFAVAIIVGSTLTITAESFTLFLSDNMVRLITAFPVVLFILIWLGRFDSDSLRFIDAKVQEQINPKDIALHKKLTLVMESEEIFTVPELTISILSENLGCKEHRLRALINQGMGFKNFSSYLKGYRLQKAKNFLSDPEHARMAMIKIANESGFASLQTFNRVFKESESCSPSSFRNKSLKQTVQS